MQAPGIVFGAGASMTPPLHPALSAPSIVLEFSEPIQRFIVGEELALGPEPGRPGEPNPQGWIDAGAGQLCFSFPDLLAVERALFLSLGLRNFRRKVLS